MSNLLRLSFRVIFLMKFSFFTIGFITGFISLYSFVKEIMLDLSTIFIFLVIFSFLGVAIFFTYSTITNRIFKSCLSFFLIGWLLSVICGLYLLFVMS
jgi:hypothetical protein